MYSPTLNNKQNMKRVKLKLAFIVVSIICIILLIRTISFNSEVDDLNDELSEKNQQIEQLQETNYSLRSELGQMSNSLEDANRRANIANMNAANAVRRMNAANSNLDQAEFWGQSGNDFMSGNSYDEARRQLDGF